MFFIVGGRRCSEKNWIASAELINNDKNATEYYDIKNILLLVTCTATSITITTLLYLLVHYC